MNSASLTKKDVATLQSLADWMDSRFRIPFTSIRFGLDSLFGLIPGVGDTITLISTVYFVGIARAHNLPWHVTGQMLCNAFIDWLIGLIPFIGDIFDIGWKSNQRNVKLIKDHITYPSE